MRHLESKQERLKWLGLLSGQWTFFSSCCHVEVGDITPHCILLTARLIQINTDGISVEAMADKP
jgi:hypothetical protein